MTLPVYLLPGPAGAAADFAFLAPMLARKRVTTAIDLPPAADLAELTAHVLALLPATPVALVGHAGGAAVAIAVAARSPLVERLVVIAGGPDGGANAASAGISAPILVVTGGRDAAPTDGARHEHRADIDSGHAVLAERPAEVLRYVDAFLEGVALWPVTP